MKTLRTTLLAAGLAGCLALPSLAADKVVLRDGSVLTGDILEQTDSYIRIRITVGTVVKTEIVFMGDVADIEHDATGGDTGGGDADEDANTGDSNGPAVSGGVSIEDQTPKASSQNPGVLLLPLKGGVGLYIRDNEIREVAKEADRLREERGIAPVIVLQIESGGGAMHEMYEIHEALMELKQRFRIVAWIKEAISAACATALHCDEIYFMSEGTAGAMTGWYGPGISLQGEERENWLRDAGEWARAGGRSPHVAVAMIGNEFELSYDKDPVTGKVTWYNNLSGEHVLSRRGQNLVLTSSQALHCGFADGVADTPEQLAKAMQLPEWYEVSDFGRKLSAEWHDLIEKGLKEIPKAYGMLTVWQNSGLDEVQRISKMIREWEKLLRWWEDAPGLCESGEVQIHLKEDIQRQIEGLQRQIGEIRRRGG